MKLLRVGPPRAERPVVLTDDGRYRDLRPITAEIDGAFLAGNGIGRVRDAIDRLPETTIADERLGAPVARPNALVCIGLNYADHAAETGAPTPERPIVFGKATSTIIGPHDPIVVPAGSTTTDYEVELAVVIGRPAHRLDTPADAAAAIAGYTIANDVSERDLQLRRGGGQWYLGKSCRTFNPLGPWLVPADEIPDPQTLALELRVNGEIRQSSNTKQMIFDVHHVIWYLSQHTVLEPGDVIDTGTPAGVALGRPDAPYLRPGDVVEATIEGLGEQRQDVRSA